MTDIDWSKAPEGATHYWPYNGCFFEKDGDLFYVAGKRSWGKVNINKGSLRELIPRPITQPAAWNGKGLPPAGCKVEYLTYGGEWKSGTYVGQFSGQMVCGCDDSGVVGVLQSGEIRPIRTPEQIAAEKREAAVAAMLDLDPFQPNATLNMMSRAEFCGALYDAGYRKQEQAQ